MSSLLSSRRCELGRCQAERARANVKSSRPEPMSIGQMWDKWAWGDVKSSWCRVIRAQTDFGLFGPMSSRVDVESSSPNWFWVVRADVEWSRPGSMLRRLGADWCLVERARIDVESSRPGQLSCLLNSGRCRTELVRQLRSGSSHIIKIDLMYLKKWINWI